MKIIIDPGHYSGYNKSPVYPSYIEGDRMWKLANYLRDALKAKGFVVGCTKSAANDYPKTNGKDDVYKRGTMAAGYDLLISLHSNACNTESVNRAVIIHPMNGKNVAVANKLGACVKSTMNLSSYQLMQRDYNTGAYYYDGKAHDGKDYYGVIRGSVAKGVPGIIIEHGFHTNTAVAKWLMSDSNLKKLAEAEAKTLAEYYKTVPTSPNEPGHYYIQAGAFASSDNADKFVTNVRALGFPVVTKKTGAYFKVYVGGYTDKASASAALSKLRASGIGGYIVMLDD